MGRSDKYLFAVLLGTIVMMALSTCGILAVSVDVLHAAWIASLMLPLCVPPMARRLDMSPVFWELGGRWLLALAGRKGR